MPLTTVGSSRNAMTFIGPSQREQTMTSTANTRFSNAAQSRRYADRGGDGFGEGAGDGVSTAGAGGGAVDGHCVGGASTGGGGTTLARRRLVGAKTPWNLLVARIEHQVGVFLVELTLRELLQRVIQRLVEPAGGAGLKRSQGAGRKRSHLFAGTVAESCGVGTPGLLAPQPGGSRGRRDLCRGMVRSQPGPAARRSPARRSWRRAAGVRVAATPAAATPPPVGIAVLCGYRRLRWR